MHQPFCKYSNEKTGGRASDESISMVDVRAVSVTAASRSLRLNLAISVHQMLPEILLHVAGGNFPAELPFLEVSAPGSFFMRQLA